MNYYSKIIKEQFPELMVSTCDWDTRFVYKLPGVVCIHDTTVRETGVRDKDTLTILNVVPVNSNGYTLREYP